MPSKRKNVGTKDTIDIETQQHHLEYGEITDLLTDSQDRL
jgi:hypothetical protein